MGSQFVTRDCAVVVGIHALEHPLLRGSEFCERHRAVVVLIHALEHAAAGGARARDFHRHELIAGETAALGGGRKLLGQRLVELGARHLAIVIQVVARAEASRAPWVVATSAATGSISRPVRAIGRWTTDDKAGGSLVGTFEAGANGIGVFVEAQPAVAVPVAAAEGILDMLARIARARVCELLLVHSLAAARRLGKALRHHLVHLVTGDLAVVV